MRGLENGEVIGCKYLDFGSGEALTSINLLVRQEESYADGTIEVRVDAHGAEENGIKLGSVRACLKNRSVTVGEGFCVDMKAIFRRNTLCISRKIDKMTAEKTRRRVRCRFFKQALDNLRR